MRKSLNPFPGKTELEGQNNYYNILAAYNPLNAELNPICHLLALLGAYHFLHVSRIRVKWRHALYC
jgi:hypothetical protein